MGQIACRAKVSKNCYDGMSEESVYPDGDQRDDGTWDGETVCCDACYMALGGPLNAELESAIRARQTVQATRRA